MGVLLPRELCAEPFALQVSLKRTNAPSDWEFDDRAPSAPRIMAAPQSTAFVLPIDPVTGDAIGTPVSAATGIVRDWPALGIGTLGNGPEWGYSQRGSELYFQRAWGTSRELWQARQVGGVWQQAALPGGVFRGLPWPSKDASDATPHLVYGIVPSTGVQPVLAYDVATRLVPEDTLTERVIPAPVVAKIGGPRWIPGQARVVMTMLDENGQEQVAIFDAESGAIEAVTAEPGLSIDETWASVYPDGTLAVWAIVAGTEFCVWTKDSGAWAEASRVSPSAAMARPARPFILSPEPFSYLGREYIAFQLCAANGIQDQASDIVVCEPSATAGCHFRIITPESQRVRRKPEWLELSGRAVVFYNETDAAGVRCIYAAETGL